MATKSFTNKGFTINSKNADKFHEIMNSKKRVLVPKVKDHKVVKSKEAIKKLLEL